MPVTGAFCAHHLWAYRCSCDRQWRQLSKQTCGSFARAVCSPPVHATFSHTGFNITLAWFCCTNSARLMSDQQVIFILNGLNRLSVAAKIRFNHLPPLKKQTVNLRGSLWGCGATWHFRPISGLLLSSKPAISKINKSAHISKYSVFRALTVKVFIDSIISVELKLNFKARFYICVSGQDLNLSCPYITSQPVKRSKCAKVSSTLI